MRRNARNLIPSRKARFQSIRTSMKTFVFEASQWVPTPVAQTFDFFADAANLEAITPSFLHFRILTPLPIEMREGARIDYWLRLDGLPVRWRTGITHWDPGVSFEDTQLRGPYAKWVHRHSFEPQGAGTRLRDRVEYAVPFDPLSRPLHALYVRPTVERIFRHRRIVISRLLGEDPHPHS